MSARVDSLDVDYFGLQATQEVNSRTSTVRTSWGALGLDVTTPDAASVLTSSASLGLDVAGASSVKVSREELNTGFATSYGSSSLTFANGTNTSASTGSLGGTYVGSGKAADATSLEITITKGGNIKAGLLGLGGTNIAFDVRDQTGEVVHSYNGNVVAGEVVSLGSDIGLSVSFAAGQLTAGHKASTTVSKTAITVDPNARFDAAAGSRPQFDAGAVVTAGSFTLNGTAIQVFANDTINTVLDRINSSAAGVTATLDSDKVTLTTKSNSEQNIDIAGDTSGFVSAVKLDGTTTTRGNLRDDERALRDTSAFRNVQSGSFTINGRTIAIDKNEDSLAAVLARISNAGAGVTASLNLTTGRIEIVTDSNSEQPIVVENDTTGFLGMAKLSTANTVVGNIRDDRQVLATLPQLAGVTSGAFLVNGVSIAVNKDTDTLSSLINRINGSGAGVTASYDAATARFVFTPDEAGATLSIDGDTSGLLAALKVTTGVAATHANADGAFNATGVNGPLFDPGHTVSTGSFTVNGVTIAVAADDTINTVVARITASSAGVVATYDDATDRVSLTSTEGGVGVTLGADTSGFLAAVKLDGTAATSRSTISYSAFNTALGEMAEYAGVSAGTLTVNGQDVAIDPMTTTLGGLVGALNALSGVSASLDQTTGAVRISGSGRSLTLADTSGVLDALGIDAGTVQGKAGSRAIAATGTAGTPSNAAEVAKRVSEAVDQMNDALDGLAGDGLRNALEDAFDRLRDRGIRGFGVAADEDRTAVSLATEDLIGSLEASAVDLDLEKALSEILEALEGAVASAAGWDASPAAVQTVRLDASRSQLMADQAAASLLHVRSSMQPAPSAETSSRNALKAYGAQAESAA